MTFVQFSLLVGVPVRDDLREVGNLVDRVPIGIGQDVLGRLGVLLEASIIGVEQLGGPEDAAPYHREFMLHSVDEVLFETAATVARREMLEDLGAEADNVAGSGPVLRYE